MMKNILLMYKLLDVKLHHAAIFIQSQNVTENMQIIIFCIDLHKLI